MSQKYYAKIKKLKKKESYRKKLKESTGLTKYIENDISDENQDKFSKRFAELCALGHVDFRVKRRAHESDIAIVPLTLYGYIELNSLKNEFFPEKDFLSIDKGAGIDFLNSLDYKNPMEVLKGK